MVTKFKVTMRNVIVDEDGVGWTHEAIDYVPVDFAPTGGINGYVEQAQAHWQSVVVDETPIEED